MTLGVQGLHTEHYPPNILRACFLFLVLGSWTVGAWTLACQRRWLFLPQRPDLSLLQPSHQRDMCEYVEGSWEHKSAGHSVHPPLFWEGQPPASRECFHFSNSPMVRSRDGASPSCPISGLTFSLCRDRQVGCSGVGVPLPGPQSWLAPQAPCTRSPAELWPRQLSG